MYWQRIYELEGDKYELERGSEIKKMEVNSKLGLGMHMTWNYFYSELVATMLR